MIKIDANLNFNARHSRSIAQRKILLEAYRTQLENALTLKEMPVFLDTNVLLYAYKISTQSKDKLLSFYKENKTNIFCTKQVQEEFLNNREHVLSRDFLSTLKKLPRNFEKEVMNPISKFLKEYKDLLHDYAFLEDGLNSIQKEVKALHEKLDGKVVEILTENKSIKFEDKVLDNYAELATTETLDKDEIIFLQKEFNILKNSKSVFPGQQDIKQKPEDPYGDFIIFHEMMKFAKKQQKNIIFLTLDFKADWFDNEDGEKKPYIHYIEKFYLNTGQIIYILDAKRALSKVLKDPLMDITDLLEVDKERINRETILPLVRDTPYVQDQLKEIEQTGFFYNEELFTDEEELDVLLIICEKLKLFTAVNLFVYLFRNKSAMHLFFIHLENVSKVHTSGWTGSKVFFFSLVLAASGNLVDLLNIADKDLERSIEKARKAVFDTNNMN